MFDFFFNSSLNHVVTNWSDELSITITQCTYCNLNKCVFYQNILISTYANYLFPIENFFTLFQFVVLTFCARCDLLSLNDYEGALKVT